jgi:hypothetical protein
MNDKYELVHEINALAHQQYGESAQAFAWGAAQSFLSVKDLEIILSILRERESEMENQW